MNQTIENITNKTKLAAGTVIFAVRAVLPLALRVAIISAVAAFLLFLYVHGPRNFIEFLFSCLVSVADVFRLPILKLHEDPPAAAVFAVLIYGGVGLVFFHPKSPLSWIAAFMILLPVSDAIYGLRYCSRAFRRHWDDPDTFYRSAKRFFRNESVLGFPIFNEPPEKRALQLETDPSTVAKMELMNSHFKKAWTWFAPYCEKAETDGRGRTKFTLFRPIGYASVSFDDKDNKDDASKENDFLHAVGFDPLNCSTKISNGKKIVIEVTDLTKPLPPFSLEEALAAARPFEYLFGRGVSTGEYVRMPASAQVSGFVALFGRSWVGKSNTLSFLAMQLLAKNPDYTLHVSSTKVDLAFLSKLPKVAKHPDGAAGAMEIAEGILATISKRKQLLKDAWCRDAEEYNSLPGISSMEAEVWISDELSDVRKEIEAEYGRERLQEFDRNLNRIAITGRFVNVRILFAMQATNMSLLWDQAAEFRWSFTVLALNTRVPNQTVSIFWDQKSGAHKLPIGQAVWMSEKGEYQRFQIPYVSQESITRFLAIHGGAEAEIVDGKSSEEKYLEYARSKWSFSIKEWMAHGVSERRLRAMSEMLQASSEIMKRPDNSLIFVPKAQSENGLQNTVPESESDDCKTNQGDDCKNQRINPEEP